MLNIVVFGITNYNFTLLRILVFNIQTSSAKVLQNFFCILKKIFFKKENF